MSTDDKRPLPEATLLRFLAEDLPDETMAKVRLRLSKDDTEAARLEQLKAERDAWLAQHGNPFAAQGAPERPRPWAWWSAGSLVAAAAAVTLVVRVGGLGDDAHGPGEVAPRPTSEVTQPAPSETAPLQAEAPGAAEPTQAVGSRTKAPAAAKSPPSRLAKKARPARKRNAKAKRAPRAARAKHERLEVSKEAFAENQKAPGHATGGASFDAAAPAPRAGRTVAQERSFRTETKVQGRIEVKGATAMVTIPSPYARLMGRAGPGAWRWVGGAFKGGDKARPLKVPANLTELCAVAFPTTASLANATPPKRCTGPSWKRP